MSLRLYRAVSHRPGGMLDKYAHLKDPDDPLMTRCKKQIDGSASVQGKELCDECLEVASRDKVS
jgi:hypothetical protein